MSLRHEFRFVATAALLAGTLVCTASSLAADKKPKTLKDLEGRRIEVRTDEPVPASAEQAMENYRAFLELQATDPKLRAEALRRLADLNLEASEIERAEREQIVAEGMQGAEAVKLYTMLLETYPDYPGGDAVLYQLARAYDSNAQPVEALAALDRMVAKFPDSSLLDEAEFRRGELLFSAERYEESDHAYATVVRLGEESTFYEQSLYKGGWSLFKLSRIEDSLQAFGRLLDRKLIDSADGGGMVDLQSLSRPERELVDDSLRVISIMFSDTEGARSADEFVARRGSPPYSWLVYARLGDLYLEKERYQDAAQTYEAFVKRDAVHPQAPLLQVRAIEAYRKGGFASLVLEGKEQFVERYGFGTAFWDGRELEQFPAVVAELKTGVMELARHYHAQAQQAGKQETARRNSDPQANYQQAARWYRSYLDWFPEDPTSASTRFLLAEALFESQQFEAAAAEYERTAYEYPVHARSVEAGYAALLAYNEREKQLADADKAAWHAKGVESGLMFATTWPEHKEAPVILTRTARELFELKDYDRAVEVAGRVLAVQPPVDADKRRVALTVIAHSYFDQQRFPEAEVAYLQLRAAIPPQDKEQAGITEKIAAAIYKQAEEKQAAGDADAAVDAFLRVSKMAPGASTARNAEYDAAAALVNMKNWPRAIEVLERFRRDYPRDPLVAEVTRTLAVAYTETSQPALAAAEFERIAGMPVSGTSAEDAEVPREALWRAAEFYDEAADTIAAARNYEQYVQRYPGDFDRAIEARHRLAERAEKAGDSKTRDRWLQAIIDADADAAARTDRSRSLAAQAALTFAEPQGAAFAAVQLRAPLKKTLGQKRDAMEKALQAYGRAAQYGVSEVTTAATYAMAELYRKLATDLMASERPAKLSADELEQYDILLEEQAFPFEEKAIEIHEANVLRSRDGRYDQWVGHSFAALAGLQPARYDKPEPQLDTLPTDNAALEAEAAMLQEHLAAFPVDAGAQTRLGLVFRRLGRFTEAAQAYQLALAADPNHTPAVLSLGVLYDLYLQDPQRALEAYEQYQQMSENSDMRVANWIAELKRRLGSNSQPTSEAPSS